MYQREAGVTRKKSAHRNNRRWEIEIVVRRGCKPRESGEKERKRVERSTRLPVLVKCCVLSKQQPRMCQPSRLTLPNGLLNADIKLARSFTLPFSSPAPSFPASATCSHYLSFSPCPSLCHSHVLCLSFTRLLLLYQPLAVFFFPCCLSSLSDFFDYFVLTP